MHQEVKLYDRLQRPVECHLQFLNTSYNNFSGVDIKLRKWVPFPQTSRLRVAG